MKNTLSVSQPLQCRSVVTRPASRRPVVTRAFLKETGAYLADGFLKTFTPADDKLSREQWSSTEGSSFKGDIPRSRQPGRNDGYGIKAIPKTAKATKAEAVSSTPAPLTMDEGFLAYLMAAAERVIGHNFKGDATEPKWSNASGWTGKRPTRDGFHAVKDSKISKRR